MEFEKFDLEIQINENLTEQVEWYNLDIGLDPEKLDQETREKLIKKKFIIQNLEI